MSIINLDREGATLRVTLDPRLWNVDRPVLIFAHSRHTELDAELFLRRINEVLQREMKSIRRAAYREGYRTGRAKRKRQEYFSEALP